jgi:threonine synthase
MDIQVASNFERFLLALMDGDSAAVKDAMFRFSETGKMDLSEHRKHPVMELFTSDRADTRATTATIQQVQKEHGYLLDPHTAVGVEVGDRYRNLDPLICLATAHPAKFVDAIVDAVGEEPHHPVIDALQGAETRCDSMPNDVGAVRDYLVAALS